VGRQPPSIKFQNLQPPQPTTNLAITSFGTALMPGMDGFQVIRHVHENPRLAPLPVVAVTAYAMRGDREKILKSRFDGYLLKPLNPSSLTAELDRLLIKSRHPADPNQINEDRPGNRGRSAKATGGT
jgi:DNA-binding response OmpR family regulator